VTREVNPQLLTIPQTVYLRRPKKEQAEATKVVIDGRKEVMEKYH